MTGVQDAAIWGRAPKGRGVPKHDRERTYFFFLPPLEIRCVAERNDPCYACAVMVLVQIVSNSSLYLPSTSKFYGIALSRIVRYLGWIPCFQNQI